MQKMKMRDLSNNLTLAEGQYEYIRDCKVRNLRAGTIRHWTDSFTNMCHYISPTLLFLILTKTQCLNLCTSTFH